MHNMSIGGRFSPARRGDMAPQACLMGSRRRHQDAGSKNLNGARKLRRSFGLMKKQWFTDTIQLRNRCPLRQSTFHLPAAYPRIDLASLVQMDPQRLGITGRLSLAYHR